MGAQLSQLQEDTERIICYWSPQFTKPERGYTTTEKEALATVSAVREFYPYLYGFPFKLITDHNPLTSLKGVKNVGGRLTRWMLLLQQFNFQFECKPGSTHSNADTLSRIPQLYLQWLSSINGQATWVHCLKNRKRLKIVTSYQGTH